MTYNKIRLMIIGIVLTIYNTLAVVVLTIIAWRNHMWDEEKWTRPKGHLRGKEARSKETEITP